MKIIGNTIQEAIDWTQDLCETTRPMAEYTLFSLLSSKLITETEEGYTLLEDEEEALKHFTNTKNHFSKNWNKTRKFHHTRKAIHEQNLKKKGRLHLDSVDTEDPTDSSESKK
jgi:hypothetical protein